MKVLRTECDLQTEFLWCSAAWRQNQLPTLPFRVCNAVRDLGIYLDSDVKMDGTPKSLEQSLTVLVY